MPTLIKQKKVALVTGASSGIGKEIARQLLDDGLEVYGAARRVEKMRDLEELGATALKMDITKEEEIKATVERIHREQNGLDVLVNNAGLAHYGAVEDTAMEDARNQFEVNFFGLARLTQLVLPSMREKKSGRIINISSIAGKVYFPMGAWYAGSKHALEGWSDCLRVELTRFHINVIIVEPGIIESEFGDVMLGPMMERSGNSAYAQMAKAVEKLHKNTREKGQRSHPSVIARIISKAVHARKPKARYVAGRFAKPLIFMRKWCGDRLFDKAVLSAF